MQTFADLHIRGTNTLQSASREAAMAAIIAGDDLLLCEAIDPDDVAFMRSLSRRIL